MTITEATIDHPAAPHLGRAGPAASRLGIRGRAALMVVAIYLTVAVPSLYLLLGVIDRLTAFYGANYARENALLHKERLLSPVLRDLNLALKLADSPAIRQWARDEANPALRELALAELESYRRSFLDESCFVALSASRHYYFNDAAGATATVRQTLDPAKPHDSWYFTFMRSPERFSLNVDHNAAVGVTKLWINVAILDGDARIGVTGTGVDLSRFVAAFLAGRDKGASGILIDRGGAIQAHEKRDYIDLNTRSKPESERSTIYRLIDDAADRAGLAERLARLEAGQSEVETFYLGIEGKRHLAAATYMPEIGWFSITLVDPSQILGFERFLPVVAVLVAALLATIVLTLILLNRTVLRPILELTGSARRIAAGQYEPAAARDRGDEIGELTRAFQTMARTVREHTATLERRVSERTQALMVANERLEASNRKILDSIRCARMLQSAILPRPDALDGAVDDHFVVWRPRDLVGGDFYFLHRVRRGALLGVVDCTGHGVPGAFMTMMAHAVISQVVKSGIDDPALLLERADEVIRDALRHRDAAADAGMEVAVCRLDPEAGVLVFAGARISLWHVAAGEVREIKGAPRSIGYCRGKRREPFVNHEIPCRPDAAFYLTTDGLLDQSGGAKGYGFGRERFAAMLRTHAALPLGEQGAAFEAMLAAYQQDRPQRDDITLLGFRLAGGAPAQ